MVASERLNDLFTVLVDDDGLAEIAAALISQPIQGNYTRLLACGLEVDGARRDLSLWLLGFLGPVKLVNFADLDLVFVTFLGDCVPLEDV